MDSTDDGSSRSHTMNHWLPIQIIGAICIILAITLVILKLYYDNELSGWQLLYFISVSILFLLSTTLISILRMRKRPRQTDNFTENVLNGVTTMNNQVTLQSHIIGPEIEIDPPPPYAVAIKIPDKQFSHGYNSHSSTPPPSYEKINII